VVNVSRGEAKPYRPHYAWSLIENVVIDRLEEEKKGTFGQRIAELQADIVIDMIAFDLDSTQQIVEALRGKIEHYLFCSSIWVYGRYVSVPSLETDPVSPIDAYGQGKAESEAWLMREARLSGFPATCFRPGHIVGEGWVPTTPQGNSNPEVYSRIARGETLALPNLGSETVHHVHAVDVAQSGLPGLNLSLLKTPEGMWCEVPHIPLRKPASGWVTSPVRAAWKPSMNPCRH